MEPQGLAQQGAQQGQPQQGMSQEQMMELVQQVAKLLMQGVSPEELLQKGVPQQVIEMAMQMIKQHQGAGQEQEQPVPQGIQGEQGLAGRG